MHTFTLSPSSPLKLFCSAVAETQHRYDPDLKLVRSFKSSDMWMWHLGTWVKLAVLGECLDSMTLKGFSNLNDSVINF